MPGKRVQPIGSTRVAQNGYHYTKTNDKKGENNWEFTHHILARQKLGRDLLPDERVEFIDSSLRSTPTIGNIRIVKKKAKTKNRIIADLRLQIEELKGKLREMGEDPCCGN